MKTLLISMLTCMLGAAITYAGTRVETSFSSFTVCLQANPLSGGLNHVVVEAGINLDTGDPSRTLGRDVLGQLTGPQKAAAVSFFNSALQVVGTSQTIATPSGLPTP